ncbi:MAG: ABC transporter permease [Firmicutes bacterium]|nr:ABC transporter permease [Bacillota bacterium]
MSNGRRFLKDSKTMFFRCTKLSWRNPETLVVAIMLPAMILILFTNLFGGAMDTDHFESTYLNFIFVGVMAMAICQGAMTQATVVTSDVSKGVLDRFMSLPIARSAFIIGHVLAASLRTLIAVILLFVIGFIMGFRTDASLAEWLVAAALIIGFIFAISWLGVLFGLLIKTVEGSTAVPGISQVLLFLSSAFVPTATMTRGLRTFANYQPATPIIDSLRYLFLGIGEIRLLEATLWIVGIFLVGFVLSLIAFRRRLRK